MKLKLMQPPYAFWRTPPVVVVVLDRYVAGRYRTDTHVAVRADCAMLMIAAALALLLLH